jgi:hypothetical protein
MFKAVKNSSLEARRCRLCCPSPMLAIVWIGRAAYVLLFQLYIVFGGRIVFVVVWGPNQDCVI